MNGIWIRDVELTLATQTLWLGLLSLYVIWNLHKLKKRLGEDG